MLNTRQLFLKLFVGVCLRICIQQLPLKVFVLVQVMKNKRILKKNILDFSSLSFRHENIWQYCSLSSSRNNFLQLKTKLFEKISILMNLYFETVPFFLICIFSQFLRQKIVHIFQWIIEGFISFSFNLNTKSILIEEHTKTFISFWQLSTENIEISLLFLSKRNKSKRLGP